MTINTSTGNPIVDAVGEMNFTGNIIPETWFKTVVNDKGKPQLNAIILLGEIVYWYRPSEVREEKTNNVYFKKKFAADDYVQISYPQINDKFGLSEKQPRDALIVLESLVVIERVFKNIKTSLGKILSADGIKVVRLKTDLDILVSWDGENHSAKFFTDINDK